MGKLILGEGNVFDQGIQLVNSTAKICVQLSLISKPLVIEHNCILYYLRHESLKTGSETISHGSL